MQQTSSLHLNQWDASDRIMREDFNRDNASIDAAYAAAPLVKLLDVTTTAAATQIDLDISGIDFSKYNMFLIVPDIQLGSITESTPINVLLNGLTGNYVGDDWYPAVFGETFHSTNPGAGYMLLLVTDDIAVLRYTYMRYHENDTYCKNVNSAISIARTSSGVPATLNFVHPNGATLLAGSRFWVYGVRK